MKVVALIHFAVPHKMAGSETMVHTMLQELAKAGHEVTAVVNEMKTVTASYKVDDVQYIPRRGLSALLAVKELRPDIILTHHQNSMAAYKLAKQIKTKCGLIVHNDHGPNIDFAKQDWDLLVFNTEWLRQEYAKHGVDGIVIHPPVIMSDHVANTGSHITLVNLNEDKGARIFYALAERFPRFRFLGVVGAHGKQIIRTDLPNVTIQENTPNMRQDVWAQTGILLMPSIYESYGMAGVEAMASGIPVIAAPTPGLKESQGKLGYFVKRDHIDGWASAIRQLTDPAGWRRQSLISRERGMEIEAQTENELRDWVHTVEDVVLGSKESAPAISVRGPIMPYIENPTASIVVPWRETPDRAEGWRWLRTWYKHYHPTWELIEADVPGEWNKPAAVNAGVRAARADVVLVMDADVLINPGTLRTAVREAQRAPWVVPHGKVHRLRPEPTSELLTAIPADVVAVPHAPVIRTPYRGVAGGGAFAMRKENFLAMGGFDTQFTGWGGEDTSFGIAADTLLGAHVRYDHVPLVHLFHDPGLRSVHPSYGQNHARQELYERAAGDRVRMAKLVGIDPFEPVTPPVPRPDSSAPAEVWLTYLRYLGIHVPHHATHQKVALMRMADQHDKRAKGL